MKRRWPAYKEEIIKAFWVSIPIVMGQVGIVLMGVADTIQVGVLGAAPIAAAGFANAVVWLVSIIGIGSTMVMGPMAATAHAQNDYNECNRLLRVSQYTGIGWGILLAIILVGVSVRMDWFRQPADVTVLARSYSYWIAASIVPLMIFTSLRQFVDGLSQMRITMLITLGGLLTNVFLNWVLITGKLGMPAFGLNGAGMATFLSRICMAIGLVVWIRKTPHFKDFREILSTQPLMPLVQKLIRVGLPGGLQLFFEIVAFSFANIMAGWLGILQQAAHTIAINMASVTYMIAAGIASAGGILVGQQVGVKNATGIRQSGTIALLLVISFMSLTCLIFLTLPKWLTSLYTSDTQLLTVTASLVMIAGFFQFSDGIQVTGLGILRGISDVQIPTWITLLAYWIIGLPLAYVFAFWLHWDVQGIWYGLLCGLTVSALLLVWRFYYLTRSTYQTALSSEVKK